MRLSLRPILCQKCNTEVEPIFLEEIGNKLHGWFCVGCQVFDKAIGRERQFTKNDYQKATDNYEAQAEGRNAVAEASENEGGRY